jgi:hypothetical protein
MLIQREVRANEGEASRDLDLVAVLPGMDNDDMRAIIQQRLTPIAERSGTDIVLSSLFSSKSEASLEDNPLTGLEDIVDTAACLIISNSSSVYVDNSGSPPIQLSASIFVG